VGFYAYPDTHTVGGIRGTAVLYIVLPPGGITTPGVLNLALRVLNLVIRVLNLGYIPGTQYPVHYRENPLENFPRQKSHPRQQPPPPPHQILGSGWEHLPEPTSLLSSALLLGFDGFAASARSGWDSAVPAGGAAARPVGGHQIMSRQTTCSVG
jgi:hypothetical protein